MIQWLAFSCFVAAAALAFSLAWPRVRHVSIFQRFLRQHQVAPAAPEPEQAEPDIVIAGTRADFLRVLDADELIQACRGQELIAHIRRQSRLSPAVFDRDLLSALRAYCGFVQLMPASEAHHHSHVGGLLAHTLEVLNAAMTFRNAYLLPHGGGAEAIDAQRDHWTYAIFFAALFHDIGKPMTDLRILMRIGAQSEPVRWMPIAGPLKECGAFEYRVDFSPKSERDYDAHRRFPLALMQRLASSHALAFIARQPAIMTELTRFLSGEAATDGKSAIAEVVKRADQESTRWNLAQGPRNRFATARAVPLIERLMQSMRFMLSAGGALPLNRDGAIGWVYDGAVWFVAKRLADTVRDHLMSTTGEDDTLGGIPGPTKNDRLFDTWQEYGIITPNPETGQAIWYVEVKGEGYCHELTMLRFPLSKLYESESLYPLPMQGSLRILSRKSKQSPSKNDADAEAQSSESSAVAEAQDMETEEAGYAPEKPAPALIPGPKTNTTPGKPIPSPKALIPPTSPATKIGTDTKAATSTSSATEPQKLEQAAISEGVAPNQSAAANMAPGKVIPAPKAPISSPARKPKQKAAPDADHDAVERALRHADPDDDLIPDEDSASHEARRVTADKPKRNVAQPAGTPSTVTPFVSVPEVVPGMSKPAVGREPSEAAIRFMTWLQQGIADGSLKYNEVSAPVHFVQQGMLLVSPRIFREFATQFGELGDGTPSDKTPDKLGLGIQRQVISAGWNAVGPRKSNIFHFSVLKRGGIRASKLAAVVILQPERWISPVPPSNPNIVPFEETNPETG